MINTRNSHSLRALNLLGALGIALVCCNVRVSAQSQKAGPPGASGAPLFTEYKGIHIGMSASEVRQKLGSPSEKGDAQDYYGFSEKETAQVYYDASQKVTALSVNYLGTGSGAPACKAVLGRDFEAKANGSMYQMIKYPKAGFWITYSRTGGDAPLTTITIQKMAANQ